jgi:hypothetical protein
MSADVRNAIVEYHDAADEFGPRMGIVDGGVYDQPARGWMLWRCIRHAYGVAKGSKKKGDDRTAALVASVRR